jgi:negative regulator of replication initiation
MIDYSRNLVVWQINGFFVKRKDIEMDAKITIKVDSGLFEQLKNYAQSTGYSISDVVERQLRAFINANATVNLQDKTKPVSSKLRGIVTLPQDFDYKSEIVLSVNEKIIKQALHSDFKDFEDAVQYYSAIQNHLVECIITRNVSDFKSSKLPVLKPTECSF